MSARRTRFVSVPVKGTAATKGCPPEKEAWQPAREIWACLIVTLLSSVVVGDPAGGHQCGQSFASTLYFCQSCVQVQVQAFRYSSFKAPTKEKGTVSGHNGDRFGTFRRSADPTDSEGEDGTFKASFKRKCNEKQNLYFLCRSVGSIQSCFCWSNAICFSL